MAVHQAVDRREIPDFGGTRRGLGRELRLGRGEIRRSRHQTDQAEQKHTHLNVLTIENRALP
jgi:hypothetical protein